jgi:hypothetical protein
VPYPSLHWIFISYSIITSTGFLAVTYWNDLQKAEAMDGRKRIAVIGVICAVQIGWLLIFKFYFFKSI